MTAIRFLYTAQEYDADSGLYYYNERWYDPATSTFLSPDPIEDDQNNPYRYVGNSPTNAVDPSGLETIKAQVVQDLVRKGLAHHPSYMTPIYQSEGSGRNRRQVPTGGAREVVNSRYVVLTDIVGDEFHTYILAKAPSGGRNGGGGGYSVVYQSSRALLNNQSIEDVARRLSAYRSKSYVNLQFSAFTSLDRVQSTQATADALTFALHMVPLGGAIDHGMQGQWGEAGISLVGDAAMFIGGPLAKLAGAARVGKVAGIAKTGLTTFGKALPAANTLRYAAIGMDGTVGGVRLGQGAYALYNDDSGQAAGYLGEAVLRLFGVGLQVRGIRNSALDDVSPLEVGAAPRGTVIGAAGEFDEVFAVNRYFDAEETALKHAETARVVGGKSISRAPTNGQHALDNSVQVSPNSPRRIGVDVGSGEIVTFDRTGHFIQEGQVVGGRYHAHVRQWSELSTSQQNALKKAGITVSKNGKITVSPSVSLNTANQ